MKMFENTGRALVIALALGATAIPAQAASFTFGFGFGDSDVVRERALRLCLTDAALRASIRAQGYKNVYLNVAIGREIQIRATKGKWVYLLQANACTGRILERERLRPA